MDIFTWLFIVIGVIALLALTAVIKYSFIYAERFRYVKIEIGRAYETEEKARWRRELLALRLSLLLGISFGRAKRLCKKAYR